MEKDKITPEERAFIDEIKMQMSSMDGIDDSVWAMLYDNKSFYKIYREFTKLTSGREIAKLKKENEKIWDEVIKDFATFNTIINEYREYDDINLLNKEKAVTSLGHSLILTVGRIGDILDVMYVNALCDFDRKRFGMIRSIASIIQETLELNKSNIASEEKSKKIANKKEKYTQAMEEFEAIYNECRSDLRVQSYNRDLKEYFKKARKDLGKMKNIIGELQQEAFTNMIKDRMPEFYDMTQANSKKRESKDEQERSEKQKEKLAKKKVSKQKSVSAVKE